MSIIHREKYRIRINECDAWGHLNHVNYFHLMQETALTACAELGMDRNWFLANKMLWVVRLTQITFLHEILFGQEITLETWVSAVEGVRCVRHYRFISSDSKELARAASEWILLDGETARPRRIGEELTTAFLGRASGEKLLRLRFEQAPPPLGAWIYRQRVSWRDLDLDWRVNNANYVAWAEESGLEILEAHGWGIKRLVEHDLGILARHYEIEYLEPALPGDQIEILTWVSAVQKVSAERDYLIRREVDQVSLARARARWVWISTKSKRPALIPAEFYAAFLKNFAPGVDDGRLERA